MDKQNKLTKQETSQKQNTRPSLKERAQYLADNLNQNLAKKYPQQTPKKELQEATKQPSQALNEGVLKRE